MFANLKIGTRLAAGFGIVIVLLGGIVVVAERSLAALNQATEQIVDDRYPQVALATELLSQVNENAISMRNMLLADNPDMLKAETAAIEAGEKSIAAGLQRLQGMLSSDAGRKAYQDMLELRTKYQAGQAEFMKLASSGGTVDASTLLMTTLRQDQLNYIARIKGFLAGGGKLMTKSGKEAAELYRQKRLHIWLLAGAACILAAGLALWITRSITEPINAAVRIARTVAGGDLSSHIEVHSRDEIGQLQQALKEMNASLRKIVSEVRGGTDAIALATCEIAQGNMDLSGRTEQQAGSLEETASALEQLTATVSQNADHTRAAQQRAQDASDVAGGSSRLVEQVVATMDAISDASRRIADITGVIDGIAFQTNILALNAAVEAARAGEQGRGFAVVASEVRNLAQRSAAAARDIKGLIEDSSISVNNGSKLAQQAGETMHNVVASVARVAGIVGEIAAASAEQSSGLGQVNQAVALMDEATQQNAALVEQAAAAAQSLQERAATLAQLVSVFRLDAHGAPPRRRQLAA
ncbi:MAG: methyl-accepting chemotaxis protein [Pseudomonadota bacterium]